MPPIEITFRPEDQDLYEAIECGDKRYELRAASDKYREITVGDTVTISCGSLRVERKITGKSVLADLDTLRTNFSPSDLIPNASHWDAVWERITTFPGYAERMAREGIIVFELE